MEGTGDKGYVSGDGTFWMIDVADRGDPIELAQDDLEGNELDLAELRGKPVVVNVWWSRCGPCRKEAPMLAELAREQEGIAEVVGINIRDRSTVDAQAFVDRFELPFPSIYDPSGKALLAFPGSASPRANPSTLVLDPEGRVGAVILGPIPSKGTVEGIIEDLAGKSADG